MNICDATLKRFTLLHRTKRIVRQLPLIFKGFLRATAALRNLASLQRRYVIRYVIHLATPKHH